MKHISQKDKRGISVILSYVLLIVIVLALSGLVYVWVMDRIPKGFAAMGNRHIAKNFPGLQCFG